MLIGVLYTFSFHLFNVKHRRWKFFSIEYIITLDMKIYILVDTSSNQYILVPLERYHVNVLLWKSSVKKVTHRTRVEVIKLLILA